MMEAPAVKRPIGRPPRLDTPMAVWMHKHGLTCRRVALMMGCSVTSALNWKWGRPMLWSARQRFGLRYSDFPDVPYRGKRAWSATQEKQVDAQVHRLVIGRKD